MVILTLNCGSSSVKYQVYDWTNKDVLASGIVERVTLGDSTITHKPTGKSEHQTEHDCPTHTVAIQLILDTLVHSEYGVIKDMSVIKAVGHRMVHGGSKFARSCLINDELSGHLPRAVRPGAAAQSRQPDRRRSRPLRPA